MLRGIHSVEALIEQGLVSKNQPVGSIVLVFVNGFDAILRAVQYRQSFLGERADGDRRDFLFAEGRRNRD
jgi:hypothetical protein